MRILVTGGAGYIGSVVVKELVEVGHQVVVIDNLQTGHGQAVARDTTFVPGDLCDRKLVADLVQREQVEGVIHFAAEALVGESMSDPSKFFRNNVCCGINLLDAMVAGGVKKIVFSSSAATYGEPASVPVREDAPTAPTNPYGESKLTFEKILRWYKQIHGIAYVSLRYFNAAGATESLGEDHSPETHLIPLVLEAALGGRPSVKIYGQDYQTPDGTCVRDFVHVLDLAAVHILAMKDTNSTIYNVGTGQGHSVKEVIAAAERVTGKKIPIEVTARRPGDPARLVADGSKIQGELDWRPRHSDLEGILESAWNWHRDHPNGYVAAS